MRLVLFVVCTAACAASPDPTPESSTVQAVCTPPSPDPDSPIVVDLAGDGFALTSAGDGVRFQLRPGTVGQWAWTKAGSDDAWLALDVDGDGSITTGAELFGNETEQDGSVGRDGFKALARYDLSAQGGDGDGQITPADTIWPRLRLWRDADHDGLSQPAELLTLDSVGIHALGLTASVSEYTDVNGNEFRLKAQIVADKPVNTTISDVWLQQGQLAGTQACTYELACSAWIYIPIGNPFGYRCGYNPGGHGVPVVTLSGYPAGIPQGPSYPAEQFAKARVETDTSPISGGLRSEVADSLRYGLYTQLLNLGISDCVPAPYPSPDPFGTATEASTSTPHAGSWSVSCRTRMNCGGCN